ncbi:hypothetical protein F5B19DRAFT_449377 [Rostrohypoxylon terebratum]|nr:hypothetical protein F5B19DRAFT_449377 [Rostrohypoxylon terebratum]
MMAPANLTTMPLEVLLEITSYLDAPSHCALRLTCRGIEAALFRTFAQDYFRKITIMRTEFSLQALVDISESRFGPYLQHVIISTRLLSPKRAFTGRRLPRNERDHGLVKYNQMCSDQFVLLETSYDQELLVEAFRNLNLQVIEVSETAPSYSPNRFLPIYGTSHIFRETSVDIKLDDISSYSNIRKPNAKCVHNVLFALGKAGARPKRFGIETNYSRFDDESLNIPPFMTKAVWPVLSNLEAIDIRVGARSMASIPMGMPDGSDRLETYYLRKFLAQSTQIKRLRIEHIYHFDGFFRWVSASSLDNRSGKFHGLEPAQPPVFTQLQELELGWFQTRFEDIADIVEKFSTTLRKLTLHDLTIILPDPTKQQFEDWPTTIENLAQKCSCLEEVSFSRIAVESGHMRRYIRLPSGSERFSYVGPDMRKVLGYMVEMLPEEELDESDGYDDEDDEELDASDDDDLADFEEYLDYVDGYDDFMDGIDDGLAEDFMYQRIFGV